MGSHRAVVPAAKHSKKLKSEVLNLPPFPNCDGKKRIWKSIDGVRLAFRVKDMICRLQSDNRRKLIVLQQIQQEGKAKPEYRLGYYMIGVKPRMKGKWTWGQFATIMPAEDLHAIITAAKKKKWLL
jgi:hypothetical protein